MELQSVTPAHKVLLPSKLLATISVSQRHPCRAHTGFNSVLVAVFGLKIVGLLKFRVLITLLTSKAKLFKQHAVIAIFDQLNGKRMD
jgi:hypothetical protein